MEAVKRLRWELTQAARQAGPPGGAAIALLLVCAAAWWGLVVPAMDETARLEAATAALARPAESQGRARAAAEATPARQLAAFQQRFPDTQGIAAALARLQAAAKRRGLQLDEAEFKLSRQAGEPLSRYAIVLPVQAEYRTLRRFTRDVLYELPGLALEEMSLRRSDPRATRLEAQLRFVLFVRDAPSEGAR